ncbi:RidA family protein [Candidatus Neomarinimicrobiota bacterium]
MSRKTVFTPLAPKAIGPYSQAIVSNGMVFTAGQIPIDPATGEIISGDFKDRVDRVLQNIFEILIAAGSDRGKIVKLSVFLTDLGKFSQVNEVFQKHFTEVEPPARSAVEVAGLPLGVDVEIECIASVE